MSLLLHLLLYAAISIRSLEALSAAPHNIDCPVGTARDLCGTIVFTVADKNKNWSQIVHQGSSPVTNVTWVISVDVEGPGCFDLYENENFDKPLITRAYAGWMNNSKVFSKEIPPIRSIQYWYDCQSNLVTRIIFGCGSLLAAVLMIIALMPTLRENFKSLHQKTSQSDEMNEASARGKNNEIQNTK